MTNTDFASLKLRLQQAQTSLPPHLISLLGSFSWGERIHNVEILQDQNQCKISFYSDNIPLQGKKEIESFLKEVISSENSFSNIQIYFERKEKQPQSPQQKQPTPPASGQVSDKKPITGVKHIIAVASGKGGVGKSTVSVNLALALYNQGFKVGILDADIYGPSIPTMLNVHQDPAVNEHNKIEPIIAHGLKIMSFGFFAPEDTAIIWRGPMIMKALQQFFWDVNWGELDFLIIDLPPGTGDTQLTLVQSLPISGAVIVTTPQNVALLDAVKGIAMFQKTDVPILGVVENMSSFTCPTCGSESYLFGSGGGQRVCDKFAVPLLGHVPLIPEIRAAGDLGEPLTTIPGHGVRLRFAEISERMLTALYPPRS